MATAPTSRRLNLTRDQLAAFLTDQQQIRQFELLFSTVDTLQVIVGTDFEYQADTAAATANEALAQISALAQDTAVDDAVLNAKIQQALDAIPGLYQALELLALAPRQELGTIASQNSDNVNITGGLISGLDAPLPVASGGTGVTTSAANQVFAGPTAGAAAAPAFRALVAADIPTLPYGTGTVTSASVVSANGFAGTVATATTTPAITMSTSISGLLYGNGTALAATTVSAPLSYSAGTLSIPVATTSANGYLSSTDWNTFNNKGSGTVTSVTGTAPVVSSGGATPAISMAAANTTTNGYLTSTDWNTFNGKGNGTVTSVAALTLGTTGTDLTSTVANGTTTPVITLNVPTASATNRGALSAADWSSFRSTKVLTWLSM